jgi:hypothetical protein
MPTLDVFSWMQEQDDTGTSYMELASHVTQSKEPRLERVNRGKNLLH